MLQARPLSSLSQSHKLKENGLRSPERGCWSQPLVEWVSWCSLHEIFFPFSIVFSITTFKFGKNTDSSCSSSSSHIFWRCSSCYPYFKTVIIENYYYYHSVFPVQQGRKMHILSSLIDDSSLLIRSFLSLVILLLVTQKFFSKWFRCQSLAGFSGNSTIRTTKESECIQLLLPSTTFLNMLETITSAVLLDYCSTIKGFPAQSYCHILNTTYLLFFCSLMVDTICGSKIQTVSS